MLALGKSYTQLQWEDFDHAKTLTLNESGTTSICYQKDTNESVVLKLCEKKDFTPLRQQLVTMAGLYGDDAAFLSTKCLFNYKQNVYVGSQLSDMSLADIIECSIPLEEEHVSTILNQVSVLFSCL